MPFIRDNRLAALLTEAHQRGADQTRRELEGRLDDHLRTVGRRNADLCAEKTDLERRLAAAERQLADRDDTIAGLREQLRAAAEDSEKDAASNASRRMVVVEAFRADIRALKDENRGLRKALADHADRLAEVTAASQDKDIPVGSVDLVKREPA